MKRLQSGFTLIELVVVIVLLGILGVTALGKFQNLSSQAADAAVQGIASELSSSSAINFAAVSIGAGSPVDIKTATCNSGSAPSGLLDSLMASGKAPTQDLTYGFDNTGDITTAGGNCTAPGDVFKCSITNSKGTITAIASIICTAAGP